ncbi:Dabb family protein [Pseudarthrobacter raffinosi]|uniref:Dabb family protein n=1 Tax=Pseudarthrobacter raffinosi TaxID=2953651 RepID=UPI00208EDBDA|nr:Dabb family protein [Pseudarthrobacter sp. MDT3-9]MCO4252141.1 Dabb family protein [Pseudarthrobacter sp. MDT3-9]
MSGTQNNGQGHHHVVVFRWKPNVDEAAVRRLDEALRTLVSTLPGLISFQCGPDLRMREGNGDFAVAATFDSAETLQNYLAHPQHQQIVAEHAATMIAEKHGVQFLGTGA